MKEKKIDAIEVWKELDALAPRLGLSVIDRTVYLHLLRLTHVEGRRRLRFSILGIAPHLGLSGGPVREAVRRLMDKGALRLIERSNIGHLVEVRLPGEIRAPAERELAARSRRSVQAGPTSTRWISCEPAPCVRPSMCAKAGCAFTVCAVRPAGHTAWTTWCRSWKVEAIRTATWFPVVWDATRRKGATRPRIFYAGSTAKGACPPKTSAHACSPCRRSRQASSAHRF